jgi:hypothetical protein
MRKLSLFLTAILLLATSAFAQSQATTGNIEGRVVDPNGAAVANVTVTATKEISFCLFYNREFTA